LALLELLLVTAVGAGKIPAEEEEEKEDDDDEDDE
jgi:hypothetical protein